MLVILMLSILLLCLSLFYHGKWLLLGMAIVSAGLYFGLPNDNLFVFIVYLLGVVLLIIELYIPDFGITGLLGLIAIATSLYMHIGNLEDWIITILLVLATAAVGIMLPLRLGKEISLSPGFVLNTSAEKERGYSSQEDLSFLIGAMGISHTPLRPVGKAEIQGKVYEVNSTEDLIASNQQIIVTKVVGAKVYVRKVGLNESFH